MAELTDYMPIGTDGDQPNEIIRTLAVIRGQVDFTMRCRPRFNYAMCGHTVNIEEGYAIFSPVGDACPPMALYSTVALRQQSQDAISEFSLRAGERATFVFGGVRAQGEQPEMEFVEQRFHETARFWKGWIAKSKYKGRWRETVNRSALMLKLGAWIADCSADIFPARTNWRSAQLGLSLHMVARCGIHALRADPTGFCRGN